LAPLFSLLCYEEQVMTKKVIMIDPPSGWKYGFPKEVPEGIKDTRKWLVENGYPQKEIDLCGEYFFCRYWEQEVEDEQQ
jgi:hypothetical protein